MCSSDLSALGLTIDYGPFGFMDRFQIDHICNHSDTHGRYSYQRQPQIMHWNMACLAGGMMPILERKQSAEDAQHALQTILEKFPEHYQAAWLNRFRNKLGLVEEHDGDKDLIENLLKLMHENRVDFTNTFRLFAYVNAQGDIKSNPLRDH